LQTFTNKMRLAVLGAIICLSVFGWAQEVTQTFEDTLLYDNFSKTEYNFPQKYNAKELFILENKQYRIKRISEEGFSIAFAKLENPVDAFELKTNIELVKTKNKQASVGVVLHGQAINNGAIVLEFTRKRRFRITKLFNNQYRYLSGTAEEQGWVKSKSLNKKGINEIKVKVSKGNYDFYINGDYVYNIFDTQYEEGNVGFVVQGNSEMTTNRFLLLSHKSSNSNLTVKDETLASGGSGITDPSFQEVIKIFKDKIDSQQAKIQSLQQQVDDCRAMLNYDTSLITRAKTLDLENSLLTKQLDSVSRVLRQAESRLIYLESLKEDIEKGSNGDLVINLTTILADIKKENKELKSQSDFYKTESEKLKEDNRILLREIDRLKYLLNSQE
jgi:hypothetical protein